MERNPALDGIRALAVLAVIAYHCNVPYLGSGALGVDVFFVLSGYLITSILKREHEASGIRYGAFYLRRARRLYPALCAVVAGLLIAGWANPAGAGRVLLYLTDYGWLFGGTPGALAHTWSLAVEEHYYLLWPLALTYVMRTKRPMWVLLAAYLTATAWTAMHAIPAADGFRFDTRMSGLIFGSLLAFAPLGIPMVVLGIATVACAAGLPADRQFVEAATACLLLLSKETTLPFVTRPMFIYVGRISYGLYLYHYPLTFVFDDGVMAWQGQFALVMLVSLACAALSYHTIEAYFRTRRAREVSDPGMQPSAA
jgi:peptidoglycan/LPS O-acetylase OafA/YrhL